MTNRTNAARPMQEGVAEVQLEQLEQLEQLRELEQVAQGGPPPPPPPPPPGVEGEGAAGGAFRVEADGKIVTMDENGVRVTESQPGVPPNFPIEPVIPPQVVDLAIALFAMIAIIVIGLPIARAFARRLDRSTAAPSSTAADRERLLRIEQAVDAMSLEVERISENQRFVTRLLTERGTPDPLLPSPTSERAGEPVGERAVRRDG